MLITPVTNRLNHAGVKELRLKLLWPGQAVGCSGNTAGQISDPWLPECGGYPHKHKHLLSRIQFLIKTPINISGSHTAESILLLCRVPASWVQLLQPLPPSPRRATWQQRIKEPQRVLAASQIPMGLLLLPVLDLLQQCPTWVPAASCMAQPGMGQGQTVATRPNAAKAKSEPVGHAPLRHSASY